MLDDLAVGSPEDHLKVASPEWHAFVRDVAEKNPSSKAAHIISMGECAENFPLEHLALGMYKAWNFDNLLRELGFDVESYPDTDAFIDWEAHRHDVPRPEYPSDQPNAYGVADDLEQVRAYLAPFIDHPKRVFVIGIWNVVKDPENAGKGGGWRWHKWGPYIGKHEPVCEYLDDEPIVEKVLLFHIIEILQSREIP